MLPFERIEPESETHRAQKALQTFVPMASLPLARGVVGVRLDPSIAATPGGQRLVVMLVHLLARMKGMVASINVEGVGDQRVHPGVPLQGASMAEGLDRLMKSLSGPKSRYFSELVIGRGPTRPDALVAVGSTAGDSDVRLGSTAWCALTGDFVHRADWAASCPIGPYMAGCFGAAEVFKRLLIANFGLQETPALGSVALSLFDFSRDRDANPGMNIENVVISDLAIAGAGAGGTAALYTLAAIKGLHGEAVVVDPGSLKDSSLGRYLLSDYDQVYAPLKKTYSVETFFTRHSPDFRIHGISEEWSAVQRPWGLTVCTVDTPEARLDVQRSAPREVVEAGVLNGTLYTVLRRVPGGWCLECKHPYDPEGTLKRRASRWGLTLEEVREKERKRTPVSRADLERLAEVQGKAVETYLSLEGKPFDEIPAITECGEGPLKVNVPSQAAMLPFATTAAGVLIAGEVLKSTTKLGSPLSNYFVHDLRYRLKNEAVKFKKRRTNCLGCSPA